MGEHWDINKLKNGHDKTAHTFMSNGPLKFASISSEKHDTTQRKPSTKGSILKNLSISSSQLSIGA